MAVPRIVRSHRATFVALAIGLALVAFAGCRSTVEVDAPQGAGTTSDVSMSQIRAKVSMTDEQAARLAPALQRWKANVPVVEDEPEAAAFEFVAASAAVLERPQLVQLVGFVREQLAARAGSAGGPGGPPDLGGHGRGHHGPGPLGPFEGLGLTPEQRMAIRAAMQTLHAAVETARRALEAGTITEEQFRAALDEARAAFDAAIADILTDEQEAQLEQKRKAHLIAALQRQIAAAATHATRRLEVLTRILGLDEAQVGAIGAILNGVGPQLETILAGLQDGSSTVNAAEAALRALHEATDTAIVAELTDEQAALFAQLRRMRHPGPPHGGGPRG